MLDYLVFLLFAVALRHALFTHHTLHSLRAALVYVVTHDPRFYNKFLAGKLPQLYDCPFCNGFWSGLLVCVLVTQEFNLLVDCFLFPISVGYVSLLIEEQRKLGDEQYAELYIRRERLESETHLR